MKVYVIGSGDDFLKERQDAVFALINHGELVSDYLHELQERKEQEKMRLRVTRKLQYVHRLPFDIHHLNQFVLFAGSMRGLWLWATATMTFQKLRQHIMKKS